MTQSGFWVSPRVLVATLHLYNWLQGVPSLHECNLIRASKFEFAVETEISSQILGTQSPRVNLVEYDITNDIGIFVLQEQYPPKHDYIDPRWILEREDVHAYKIRDGVQVACIGYNGRMTDAESAVLRTEISTQLHRWLQHKAFEVNFEFSELGVYRLLNARQVGQPDVDPVTKAALKSFAPGTLDALRADEKSVLMGVSSSLWKGSSGGPCVILEGPLAGAIIGTGKST